MRIHPAAKAIPEMLPEEFAALRADIEAHGLLVPIEVLGGQLLDGRHRLRLCKELGIKPATVEVDLGGMTASEYVWSVNGARRHLTASQRAAVAAELLPELKKAAKERQREHGGTAPGKKNTSATNGTSDSGRARDEAAALVGVGKTYVSDAETLQREAPDLFAEVKTGKITVSKAKREAKKREVTKRLESIESIQAKELSGEYDTIVIDPPWPMEKIERDVRPNQSKFDYPTMTIEEMADLKLPAAADCHLWLWTTQRFLPDAFGLLDSWGFRYVCTFVWHKPGGFQPIGLPQYNAEFALYARHGSPTFIDTKAFPVCFEAPRGKHSEKPEAFYDVVRRVTAGRRADMFNRRKIDGFEGWGKEAQ